MAAGLWRVVGGADKGGILVRSGHELTSSALDERLSYDAVVEELARGGDRLQYRLISGSGPKEGWVSVKLKDKVLLTEEAPKVAAEIKTEYIEVLPTRTISRSVDYLQRLAKERALSSDPDKVKLLETAVDDLLIMARDRSQRDKIIAFLGTLLSTLYVKGKIKPGRDQASNIISWKLCAVAFASSMQDILWCPATSASSFIVLLFGFGGSHMNDLRPAVETWSTRYGADVLAFGPALNGRWEMLDVVFEKLMSLLGDGRPVVVHMCSDGGFSVFRAFLKLWSEREGDGVVNITPSQVVRCIVGDCSGLGAGNEGMVKDGTYMEPPGDVQGPGLKPAADVSEEVKKKAVNDGAQAFFAGCGINMFMHAGACTKFYEEPADSFGRSLATLIEHSEFEKQSKLLSDVSWDEVKHHLAGVPVLVITSKGDKVVHYLRCLFLADCVRKISGRKSTLAKQWPGADEKVLGDDGLAVHTHIFPKAAHCRIFLSDPDEYWTAVDRLVKPCVSSV